MIIRSDKNTWSYTRIDNRALTDSRLSFKARGVLSFLLSKPDKWQVNLTHLIKQSPGEEHLVRSAVKELEQYGYMKKIRLRDSDGKFTKHDYRVSDYPYSAKDLKNFNDDPGNSAKKPLLENPVVENFQKNDVMPIENGDSDEISPLLDFPRVDNPVQVTTESKVTTDFSLVTTEREDAFSNFEEKEKTKTRSDSDGDTVDRFSGSYAKKPEDKEPHQRIATIPGRLKNSIFRIHFKDVLIWSAVYSLTTDEIETELRKMELWCKDNPRKLKKDMRSFVTRWLSRVSAEHQNKRMKSNVAKKNFSDGYPE